jgi:hypothetical protein
MGWTRRLLSFLMKGIIKNIQELVGGVDTVSSLARRFLGSSPLSSHYSSSSPPFENTMPKRPNFGAILISVSFLPSIFLRFSNTCP